MKMKKINQKIALTFCAVLLLFSILLSVLFSSLYVRHVFENDLQEQAVEISRYIQNQLRYDPYMLEKDNLHKIHGKAGYLEIFSNLSDIQVWIVTSDNRLISYNNKLDRIELDEIPTRYKEVIKHILEGQPVGNKPYHDVWNRSMFGVGVPIYSPDNEIVGAVLMQTSSSRVSTAVHSTLQVLSVSTAIVLIIGFVIALILSRIITSPLRSITKTAHKLMDGDYHAKTGISQADEVGELAQTLDALSVPF